MEIILHIGSDKTGSTSIQRCLLVNRGWFLERSVYIPTTGLGISDGHGSVLGELDQQSLDELAMELASAAGQGYLKAVLSWEGMCKYSAGQIARLAGILGGYDKQIVIYLREQAEIIQTGQLQRTKTNINRITLGAIEQPKSLREVLESWAIRNDPRRNYYRLLRRWKRAIPRARFVVRIFNRSALRGGDVVTDFIHQLGCTPDAHLRTTDGRQNASLDVESALLIEQRQSAQETGADIERISDIAQSVINTQGAGSKYFLARSTVESIRKHYLGSNRKLGRDFMGLEGDPFAEKSRCWRTQGWDSLEQGAEKRSRQIREIDMTPTLNPPALRGEVSQKLDLVEGWSVPESWGVWSEGQHSRIRFRVMHRYVTLGYSFIRFVVRGCYYGDNRVTRISINGMDFGDQELVNGGDGQLQLPVERLLPHEVVEISLSHTNPVTPLELEGAEDARLLAFGLYEVGYEWIE